MIARAQVRAAARPHRDRRQRRGARRRRLAATCATARPSSSAARCPRPRATSAHGDPAASVPAVPGPGLLGLALPRPAASRASPDRRPVDRAIGGDARRVRAATVLRRSARGRWLIDPVMFDSALQLFLLWARAQLDKTTLPSAFRAATAASRPVRREARVPHPGARAVPRSPLPSRHRVRRSGRPPAGPARGHGGHLQPGAQPPGRAAGTDRAGGSSRDRLSLEGSGEHGGRHGRQGRHRHRRHGLPVPGRPDLRRVLAEHPSKVDAISDPPAAVGRGRLLRPDVDRQRPGVLQARRLSSARWPVRPAGHGVMPLAVEGGEPDQWLALQVARAGPRRRRLRATRSRAARAPRSSSARAPTSTAATSAWCSTARSSTRRCQS